MTPYLLSSAAEADPDAIWLYVATSSGVERADQLVDGVVERFFLAAQIGILAPSWIYFFPVTTVFSALLVVYPGWAVWLT